MIMTFTYAFDPSAFFPLALCALEYFLAPFSSSFLEWTGHFSVILFSDSHQVFPRSGSEALGTSPHSSLEVVIFPPSLIHCFSRFRALVLLPP